MYHFSQLTCNRGSLHCKEIAMNLTGRIQKSRGGAKLPDGRQAQGQGRQRSIIQRWDRGTGRQAGYEARTGKGQKQEDEKKRGRKKTGSDRTNAGKLDKQDELATDRKHRYNDTG